MSEDIDIRRIAENAGIKVHRVCALTICQFGIFEDSSLILVNFWKVENQRQTTNELCFCHGKITNKKVEILATGGLGRVGGGLNV